MFRPWWILTAVLGLTALPARAALKGPLMINGKALGVEVSHEAGGAVVDRAALAKVFGPLDELLGPGSGPVALERLKEALAADTKPPPWKQKTELTPPQVHKALSRALRNLQDARAMSAGDLADVFERALDDAAMEAPKKDELPPGAVSWWLRRTDITDLRGSKEGGRMRMVLAARPGTPLRITLEKLEAHRYRLNCLFCDSLTPLKPPDLTGLSKMVFTPTPIGFALTLWLRPEEAPRPERMDGPPRLLLSWPLNYESVIETKPHTCLDLRTVMKGDERGALTYHVAKLKPRCNDLKVTVLRAADRLGKTRDPLAIANVQKPVLLVNGGFFDGAGMPIGVYRKDGVLMGTGGLNRTAAIFEKGKVRFDKPKVKITFRYRCGEEEREIAVNRVNLPPRPDAYSLYTSLGHTGNLRGMPMIRLPGTAYMMVAGAQAGWGKAACNGVLVPVTAPAPEVVPPPEPEAPEKEEEGVEDEEDGGPHGVIGGEEEEKTEGEGMVEGGEPEEEMPPPEPLMVTPDPAPGLVEIAYFPEDINEAPDIIEAGPRLVRDGTPRTEAAYENFTVNTGHFGPDPAPRTALGVNKETGETYFVVVYGRHRESRGVTLQEMAELMASIGATDAVNLDGGGSSVMIVNGQVLSKTPLLGDVDARRPVPNAVAVVPATFREAPYNDQDSGEPYIDPNIPPLPEMPPGLFDGAGDTGSLPHIEDGFKPVEEPNWRSGK